MLGTSSALWCAPAPALGQEILDGVREIASPGTPGNVVVWGDGAEALVCGGRAGAREAVVASASLGAGRIVAFGHTGYLDAATIRERDTQRLVVNAVRWAGRGAQPRVGILGARAGEALRGSLEHVEEVDSANLAVMLGSLDVLVLGREDLSEAQAASVRDFVERGGGLVVAQTGWGWRQIHQGRDLRDHAINRIMAPAGLAFGDGTPDATRDHSYSVDGAPRDLVNASRALALLERQDKFATTGKQELTQSEASLSAATRVLPARDAILRPRLAALMASGAGGAIPSVRTPLARGDALSRVLLAWRLEEVFGGATEVCEAHPAAAEFPGLVSADAPRGVHERWIDTGVPGWHSLGLYAPAGETVSLDVPEDAVHAGLTFQIGSHTDELWHLEAWKRAPRVVRNTRVQRGVTALASPFGGLVYVDVPRGSALGELRVRVSGAVEAPLFVRGKTDLKDWRERIRALPGPWAELASDKVIVSVPSSEIRDLANPDQLMELWDRVLDAAADLATIPRERERPERYVADVQISAGYMHSGYPIMTHLDAARAMSDPGALAKGNWGLFHELGHNHQERDWTFDGTGEVTCNLFSLYIMETVCGRTPAEAHEANDRTSERIMKYFDKPASLERWSSDPFTALVMYRQMRDAFGWDVYKRVFAEYRALTPGERPKSDQARRDHWMERMSRASGMNLGPFFDAWGVTTSPEARERVADLKPWMPEGMPPAPSR